MAKVYFQLPGLIPITKNGFFWYSKTSFKMNINVYLIFLISY